MYLLFGRTAAVADSWPIAPGKVYIVIEGVTGDIYGVDSAALTAAVEQLA